jgi:UDP-N-acetyl-D-glucosamine dehydrogenase
MIESPPALLTDPLPVLLEAVANRTARIGVIGLGYVGLPLAQAFSAAGFPVLGFDTSQERVDCLQNGGSYLRHVPPAAVQRMRSQGFQATHSLDRLDEPDALLLCVPTALTQAGAPDLGDLISAVDACSATLRPGQLVVVESTVFPGATRQVVQALLEESGLKAGEDFFLAFSPEREDPGNQDHSLRAIAKVVGAVDPRSQEAALALYGRVMSSVVPVDSTEIAEASKLLENAYRAVNIGLVNELKVLFDRLEIDIWEVIQAAATKPFGFQPFYPGPGLGGACIPVNPLYLSWLARKERLATRFIDLADEVNSDMPAYVAWRLREALAERGKPLAESQVLLLGMAYKRDVNDCRESPGLALMDLLLREGATVSYHDFFIAKLPASRRYPHLVAQSQPLTEELLEAQDAVVIVTDHTAYDWPWVVAHAAFVLDTRNAVRELEECQEKIVRA